MPLLFIGAWRQFQVALHRLTGLAVAPAPQPHQQIDPRAAAPQLVLAAALVAEPGAAALAVIKAVAIPTAAERAGLVAIEQKLGQVKEDYNQFGRYKDDPILVQFLASSSCLTSREAHGFSGCFVLVVLTDVWVGYYHQVLQITTCCTT